MWLALLQTSNSLIITEICLYIEFLVMTVKSLWYALNTNIEWLIALDPEYCGCD